MDYSKMSDAEINAMVMDAISDGNQAYSISEGPEIKLLRQINTVEFGEHIEREEVYATFDPCNNPANAWPIIVENGIGIIPYTKGLCEAWNVSRGLIEGTTKDKNPLRAAMIVYLMMQEAK